MTTNEWQIKDLTGVGDVELSLDDSKRVFVLFGSNGVGKTRILSSFFFFLSIKLPEHTIQNVIFKDFNRFKSVSYNKENFNINDRSEIKNYVDESKINHVSLLVFFKNIEDIKKDIEAICYIGAKSRLEIDDSNKQKRNNYYENIGSPHHDIKQWIIAKAQSVNPYQRKSQSKKNKIEFFLESLNKIDNRIEKHLSIDDDKVYLKIAGQERELSELSSGFHSLVRIIQSIISSYAHYNDVKNLFKVKGVVLIDEIENHLHLEWQTKIIPTLKDLFPNTTFYIATHSPLVLSQLEEGEAYVLKRDDDGVVRSEMIKSPNKRAFASVLEDAFGINLNQLKRDSMQNSDQSDAKSELLALLDGDDSGK